MDLLILGGSPSDLGGVETFCDRASEALRRRIPGIQIQRIATGTAYLTCRKLPRVLDGLSKLVRYRLKRRGLVWLHYVNLPDLGYLVAARLLGLKVVVTPHLGKYWRSERIPLLRWMSRALLSRATHIALLSKTQVEEIALPAYVPRSTIRTFLPHDLLGLSPTRVARPAHVRLLHASRLSEAKGSFLMIDVCARLRDAGVPFSAQVIGGADEETHSRLRAMISNRKLEQQVELIGWIPPSALIDHLREADMLIHLSRVDSYPLIVLEALASGMMPVAIDLAGARDMIETYDGVIVSEAASVEESAAFIARADLADVRRRGAREAGRVRADFAWDNVAALLAKTLGAV